MATSAADKFAAELGTIASLPVTDRAAAYIDLFRQTVHQPETELPAPTLERLTRDYLDAAAFSDLNSTGGGLVVGRDVLTAFQKIIADAGRTDTEEAKDGEDAVMGGSGTAAEAGAITRAIDDADVRIALIDDTLERLQPKILSYEEQATQLRILLSSILEQEHDWIRAAKALQGISLDGSSGQRSTSDLFRLRTNMRIVRLLLEGDDPVQADVYLKRASLLLRTVPGASSRTFGTLDMSDAATNAELSAASSSNSTEQVTKETVREGRELALHFQLCQARIYDSQKRFAEAATRFHKLSYIADIDPADREMMLSAAVTAAILAPAGVTRTRILGTLVRDERTASLPAHQYAILNKVFLQQIVRPKEMAAFEEMLAPHQKAILVPTANEKAMLTIAQAQETATTAGDVDMDAGASSSRHAASQRHAPRTVLERAIIEHNVLAASRIYTTITLSGLGSLLDMSPFGAETIARRMIKERRLAADIDQVEGVLTFLVHGSESGGEAGGGVGLVGGFSGEGEDGRQSVAPGATTSPLADIGGEGGAEGSERHAPYTRRWDAQIGRTASALEDVYQRISRLSGGIVSQTQSARA